MPDKNKTNLGLAPAFLLIQRCARVLYACINALTRLVLPKNMGARLACNQNAAIFDDFWQSRTPTYYTYFKREFDKKGVNIGVLAGFVLLLSGIGVRLTARSFVSWARSASQDDVLFLIVMLSGA